MPFGYAALRMRTSSRIFSSAIVVAATTLASCTIAPPQVTLTSIRRSASSPQANAYEFEFALRNTHPAPVELETWSYSVTAADGSTYGGSWAALAVIPAESSKSLVIPAVLDATAQTGIGATLAVSGELGYRDPGNLARLLRQMGLLKSRSTFAGSATIQVAASSAAATTPTVEGGSVPVAPPAPAKPD